VKDALGPPYQAREMEKLYMMMKAETMAAIIKESSSQSMG